MVAAIKPPYVLDCQVGSFPSCWEPQQTNTQLFEVDVTSSEVAELVQTLRQQQQQLEIVKVPAIAPDRQHQWLAVRIPVYACTNKQAATYLTSSAMCQHCWGILHILCGQWLCPV